MKLERLIETVDFDCQLINSFINCLFNIYGSSVQHLFTRDAL
jgi:hypothetical protein